jgi:hypothetical protein
MALLGQPCGSGGGKARRAEKRGKWLFSLGICLIGSCTGVLEKNCGDEILLIT